MEIIQILKNMGQLFFDAESIYEISKPYLKFVTDGRTSPKQYDPSTFSKLGPTWGHKKSKGVIVISALRLSCYLLLNHGTKSNQIWCVIYTHEWGVQQHTYFWPHPLGRGQGQISLNFNNKVNFDDVITNKRYKTYQRGFLFFPLGHAWECPEGQKFTFKNMVMWHIKLTGMMSRTECK